MRSGSDWCSKRNQRACKRSDDGTASAGTASASVAPHAVRNDGALYDYVGGLKARHLKNAAPLSKVIWDGKLASIHNALGTHTRVARVQGGKLRTKREIRIANLFREAPEEFLRMIVAHELAHLKEPEHDKAFYQLCTHMEADYHQLEFDVRFYLSYLDTGAEPLWS